MAISEPRISLSWTLVSTPLSVSGSQCERPSVLALDARRGHRCSPRRGIPPGRRRGSRTPALPASGRITPRVSCHGGQADLVPAGVAAELEEPGLLEGEVGVHRSSDLPRWKVQPCPAPFAPRCSRPRSPRPSPGRRHVSRLECKRTCPASRSAGRLQILIAFAAPRVKLGGPPHLGVRVLIVSLAGRPRTSCQHSACGCWRWRRPSASPHAS